MAETFTRQQRWVLGLVAGGSFIAALDGMVVTTALDSIRRDLSAPITSLHWTMTAYSLSFAAMLMAGAAMGDRFGRRRVFIAGLLLFAATSVACAAAPSIGLLIAGRAVQGAASALLVPVAMALLGAAVTPAQRPRAMGLFSGITGLALVSGPVVGGAIVDSLGWRWVFWINVPLCLTAALLVRLRVPRSQPGAPQTDWLGVVLLAIAMTGLLWGLTQANVLGWANPYVVVALVAGVIALLAFLAVQYRYAHALVPPRLLRSRPFRAANVAALLLFASMLGTLLFMAQFFQVVHRTTASGAGSRMLPWTITLFVVMPGAGAFAGRVGERLPAVAGLLLQSVALVWMSSLTGVEHSYAAWIPPMVLVGAGISLAMPALQSAVLGAVMPADIGKASGVFNTMRQLGWACGAAASVAVFGHFGSMANTRSVSSGFTAVLVLTASSAALGAVCSLRLRSTAVASPVSQPANPTPEIESLV